MDEEQKKKYRLLDNKTGELADWDMEKLEAELQGLDFGKFDVDWGFAKFDDEELEALMADEVQNRGVHRHRVTVDVDTEREAYNVQNLLESNGYKCKVQNS